MENNSINYLGFEEETPAEALAYFLEHEGNGMYQTWDDYCTRNNKYEDRIYTMGQFDELCDGLLPHKIVELADSSDFCINDNYYIETMYGLESSDDIQDLMTVDFFTLAEDILEHPDSYYDKQLKTFLEEVIYSQWQFERK